MEQATSFLKTAKGLIIIVVVSLLIGFFIGTSYNTPKQTQVSYQGKNTLQESESSQFILPESEPTPPTPKATVLSRIEGLTAIDISSGSWQNWDGDIENDGPVINITYRDRVGNIISGDAAEKMQISADVKVYAGKSTLAPKNRLVFSANYTSSQIIFRGYSPEIRIAKEQMSVNPATDYEYGLVKVTIHTPEQGDFSAQTDIFVLYEN